MFLISGITLAVCILGKVFPAVEFALWTVFLGFLAANLYFDLREPVNYTSLDFDSWGFRYEATGFVCKVAWCEIRDVIYARQFDPFANAILTEWHFYLKSGESVWVLVEWPHRKQFARAVVENLDFVSKDLVTATLRMRGEGQWRCIDEQSGS
jgi:hypothetical protein